MRVPMLDVALQHARLETELVDAFRDVLGSSRFILGEHVQRFEREIAAYVGSAQGVGCSNGTDALTLALQAAGVGEGDEVITTPFTFFATVGAILRLRAVPRFVDIGADDFHLDVQRVEALVSPRTRAVITVHLFGAPVATRELRECCDVLGLVLIEDAAQALGAIEGESRVGSIGHFGCFSFFPSKPLGGFGDGGMITTSEPELAERCRRLRAHGAIAPHEHVDLGANFRLDELQAALLRVKLRYLEEMLAQREAHAQAYERALEEHPGVLLHRLPLGVRSARAHFTLRLKQPDRRERILEELQKADVQAAVYYRKPVYRQAVPALQRLLAGDEAQQCVHTERRCAEVLTLPLFPEMSIEQREHVISSLLRALS
ncbi:MAG: DegT/DnrJ/EryC1/StrS family aminotransferase [Polyangiaceae bacterium]